MGSGNGGGFGSGNGAGYRPGDGSGFGGSFGTGGGITPPVAIYRPDPEFSEQARRARYGGTVWLSIVIDADGRARDIKVVRSLGMGLDEKAIKAVPLEIQTSSEERPCHRRKSDRTDELHAPVVAKRARPFM